MTGPLVFSVHAQQRMHEMDVTLERALEVVDDPEVTYGGGPSRSDRYPEHQRTYQRGQLAVIVDEVDRVVLTVLVRTQEEYER